MRPELARVTFLVVLFCVSACTVARAYPDCNNNSYDDAVDLSMGISEDCDVNLIPRGSRAPWSFPLSPAVSPASTTWRWPERPTAEVVSPAETVP
ncbi:MAG: hypothetical protein PVI86_15300 [Phycisphaerae bacterium]|jgi:hypothetical protein